MQRAHKEWMTRKGWLFSPWLVIWGEEMVEGLLFQPHGIWDVEGAGE